MAPARSIDPDIRLLQAAGDPTRLAILRELSADGSVCACDFTSCCDVAQPTVSHHLKVLREAGWVTTERRGTSIYYSLRSDAIERFRGLAGELRVGASATAAELSSVAGRAGSAGADAVSTPAAVTAG